MARRVKFARATTSLRLPGDKYPTTVREGSAWWADHPAVLANPELFADEPQIVLPRNWTPKEAPVEQATAAPGEKRGSRRGG